MNNNNTPLVSIILPTYKRAHVLPIAIRSVLAQSYKNIEFIIVDDNSPDNTREVVDSFDDPRIQYVCNNPNLKLPRALNRGFSLARGDYLTWTSDDNLFAPTAIECMINTIQTSDCDFVYADYYLFAELGSDNQPIEPMHDRQPSQLQLEKGNHIGACFMYTRKLYEAVGDYDPELFLVEDYDYFIRAAKQFCFCHIPEPLYYFRRDDQTLYFSRFCEVKASDVLVRYKNELISQADAINIVTALVVRNIEGLKNPFWRLTYQFIKPISYRLTNALKRQCENNISKKLSVSITPILEDFHSKKISFAEARDNLVEMMNNTANIQPA